MVARSLLRHLVITFLLTMIFLLLQVILTDYQQGVVFRIVSTVDGGFSVINLADNAVSTMTMAQTVILANTLQ